MSVGHAHRDAPAPAAAVVRILQRNPGLRAHLAGPVIVNRKYRVPYLAGSSIDGWTTYIDSQTPLLLPKSRVEPDRYYPKHERSEWWLMVMRGMPYLPGAGLGAHRIAHGIEQNSMRLDGIDDDRIAEYEAESWALADTDEHAELPPEAFPPDLYLGPYQAAEDSDRNEDQIDKRLLPLLRAAQRLPDKLSHAEAGYTAGSGQRFCRTCEYSDHAAPPVCRYVEDIAPEGVCRLWHRMAA